MLSSIFGGGDASLEAQVAQWNLGLKRATDRLLAICHGVKVENELIRGIRTLTCTREQDRPGRLANTLILLHGYGSGSALWAPNLQGLTSVYRTVYLLDMPGFAGSQENEYCSCSSQLSAEEAEKWIIERLEAWVSVMRQNLPERWHLAGHSLGAFICAAWSLSHPANVAHLVMLDPFGMAYESQTETALSLKKALRSVLIFGMEYVSPFAVMRAAGPYLGKALISVRRDIIGPFAEAYPGNHVEVVSDYIYHCNCQPSAVGESLFKSISYPTIGFASRPLSERLHLLSEEIGMSYIFGENSFVATKEPAEIIIAARQHLRDEIREIKGAGHHIYTHVQEFNRHFAEISRINGN